eukprot:12923885-Prorocentrum_lima.AAC.1
MLTLPSALASASAALVPRTQSNTPEITPLRHSMHGWHRCALAATPASKSNRAASTGSSWHS